MDGLNWATQDGDRNEAQDALLPLALDVATIWVRRQPTVRATQLAKFTNFAGHRISPPQLLGEKS